MNRTLLGPILVFMGIAGVIALAAKTDVFQPLIAFVHSDAINPLQAAACIAFTILGFAACFYLLNILCTYFVPKITANEAGGTESDQRMRNGHQA